MKERSDSSGGGDSLATACASEGSRSALAPPLYAHASKEGSGFEGASARVSSMLITCASGTPAELRPAEPTPAEPTHQPRGGSPETSAPPPRLVDCVAVPSVYISAIPFGCLSAISRLVDCVAVPSVQHLDRRDPLLEHRLMYTTAR